VRRAFWFTTGATAGFGGAMWIRRRALRALQRYAPGQIQTDVASSVKRAGGELREAVAVGRAAMRRREAELRAELQPSSGGRQHSPTGRRAHRGPNPTRVAGRGHH
jgi:hypothetical protein